ncbi:cytochrome P450 [Streptomyces rubellomurinus]|uniref:Cytochrome P450 n=1 Tax=Streptomyces sp. Y1 TaxID=3238634 RepID=A0AB39TWS3_9ACTN|nr:cytochrome P450 [Streptomyces rubellomurinus]
MSEPRNAPAAEQPAGAGELPFNPADPALQANPYPAYRLLRDAFPALQGPHNVWLISRYEDVEALLRDRRLGKDFSNSTFFEQITGAEGDDPLPFLGVDDLDAKLFMLTDPPEHTRLRGLVAQAFTPATITALRESVAEIVDELLGELPERFDIMDRLATPLPIRVLGTMLGIPEEDRERFTLWTREIAALLDFDTVLTPEQSKARRVAVAECTGYFVELATRRDGTEGDDIVSQLVRARDEGSALTTHEIAASCLLIVVAAQETFSNLIGNAALVFARHPEALAHLADDPKTTDATINEILRLEPPAHQVGRIALEEVELHGKTIKPGEAVILMVGSANRDERVFTDPDTFLLDREGPGHLSYSRGIHYCLGGPLATMMAREALLGLATRITSLELADKDVTFKPGSTGLRGPAQLPLVVTKR